MGLLDELKERAVTNMPVNRWSVVANQIYKSTDLGILQYDGEVQENDTIGDGVIHAEFYADTESIANVMVQLCAIDEEHIIYTGIE